MRLIRRRRRSQVITLFTGLAVLAALSVVSAVLQAAQALGHLIALGLLAAMAAGAFHLGRRYERGKPRPRALHTEASAVMLPPASHDDLLADPRSGVRPLGGDP